MATAPGYFTFHTPGNPTLDGQEGLDLSLNDMESVIRSWVKVLKESGERPFITLWAPEATHHFRVKA